MCNINEGDCFLVETNRNFNGEIIAHLMVTVVKIKERIALVPICSDNGGKYVDQTCTLKQGCHPFVKKPSFVSYAEARFFDKQQLIDRISNGTVKPKPPFDEKTFMKIKHGIARSDATPLEIFNAYDDQRFGDIS